ncbi:MAG: chitobiase/beta-hexosaminidase C-terminal domain-containing protein [Labilithrix sp.]
MKRRGFVIVAVVAVATGIVVACGGEDDAPPPSTLLDGGGKDGMALTDASAQAEDSAPRTDAAGDADAAVVLAAPSFSPPPAGDGPSCVIITAPAGVIHYTTDGSTPMEASPVFSTPIVVEPGLRMTIRAIAIAGATRSAVSEETYLWSVPGTGDGVHFDPAAGDYDASVEVRLSFAPATATICYTLDGGLPDCVGSFQCADATAPVTCVNGIAYDGGTLALAGDAGTKATVKARACRSGVVPSEPLGSTYAF